VSALHARLVPLGLLLAAGAAFVSSRRLEIWTEDGPGPGLMPKIALGLMAVLALAVTIVPGESPADEADQPRGVSRTFAVYALACLGMALATPFTGFVLTGLVCVAAVLRFAEDRSWAVSIGYAVALIGTLVLLFGTALKVQFPDGPAERLLREIRVL
jgi:hypothetical protein